MEQTGRQFSASRQTSRALTAMVLWLPVVGMAIWLFLAFNPATYDLVVAYFDNDTREYTHVEMATAIAFLLASAMGLWLSVHFYRTGGHLLSAAAFLIFAACAGLALMEEIQWAQPLLEYDVPAWMRENNEQGEFTFHNLEGAQANEEVLYALFCLLALALTYSRNFVFVPQRVWSDLRADPILLPILLCVIATTALKASMKIIDWDEDRWWAIRWTTEITELYIALWALIYVGLKILQVHRPRNQE